MLYKRCSNPAYPGYLYIYFHLETKNTIFGTFKGTYSHLGMSRFESKAAKRPKNPYTGVTARQIKNSCLRLTTPATAQKTNRNPTGPKPKQILQPARFSPPLYPLCQWPVFFQGPVAKLYVICNESNQNTNSKAEKIMSFLL